MNSLTSNVKLGILCWNLHAGIDWYGRFLPEQLITCIQELDPDLCGFQEVDRQWSKRSHFCDLAQILAAGLKMHAAFSPALVRQSGSYGNLILSRYPLLDCWLRPLADSQEPRSFCCVQVETAGIRFAFLTTHLGLTALDRCRQVEQIQKFISRLKLPLILCGDFNAGLEDRAVQMLTGKYCDLQQNSMLAKTGTFRLADGQVGPRIDYILTTPEFGVEQFQVISNYCSDHLPLFARVNLGRRFGPVYYR